MHTPGLQTLLLAWHVQACSPPPPAYSIPNQPKPDQHPVKGLWNKINRTQIISAEGLPVKGTEACAWTSSLWDHLVPGATLCTGTPVPEGWPPFPAPVSPHRHCSPRAPLPGGPAARQGSAFWEEAGSCHVPVPVRTHCSPLAGSGPREEAATLAGGGSAGRGHEAATGSPQQAPLGTGHSRRLQAGADSSSFSLCSQSPEGHGSQGTRDTGG